MRGRGETESAATRCARAVPAAFFLQVYLTSASQYSLRRTSLEIKKILTHTVRRRVCVF